MVLYAITVKPCAVGLPVRGSGTVSDASGFRSLLCHKLKEFSEIMDEAPSLRLGSKLINIIINTAEK